MTSHSYHVVMIRYPRRTILSAEGTELIIPACQEAVVNPEFTRRDIIDMVRKGELKDIAFIHYVIIDETGSFAEDVTQEILDAAQLEEVV